MNALLSALFDIVQELLTERRALQVRLQEKAAALLDAQAEIQRLRRLL